MILKDGGQQYAIYDPIHSLEDGRAGCVRMRRGFDLRVDSEANRDKQVDHEFT